MCFVNTLTRQRASCVAVVKQFNHFCQKKANAGNPRGPELTNVSWFEVKVSGK
jgi:hypothetical protein